MKCGIVFLYLKILRETESKAVWRTFSEGQTINSREKWYIDRINYLKGDVNTDGYLDVIDITLLQRMLLEPNNPSYYDADKKQTFLADVNGDSLINTNDIYDLQIYILDNF